MKKTFLLIFVVVALSSCVKNETCTCKLNGKVTFTESIADSQKLESDCEAYNNQANAAGTTTVTICQVQ